MMEKPILFNTEMVRAILDGRKTQTRRLIRPQPEGELCYIMAGSDCGKWNYMSASEARAWDVDESRICKQDDGRLWTPPCQADDVLYVRETWTVWSRTLGIMPAFHYKADGEDLVNVKWHPSIHMPKEAARIWLNVSNVRCERLQDMDEDDAYYEGFRGCPHELKLYFEDGSAEPCHVGGEGCSCDYWYCDHSPQEAFGRDIWDKTIKPDDLPHYGWDANPWVWVIEFERVEGKHDDD